MDGDGYPTEMELERIEKWDVKDFANLLDYVEYMHTYKTYLSRKVIKEDYPPYAPVLEWRFSTGGWSGNESLIYALLKNFSFKHMWYYSWRRGGHYVFRIDPRNVGFKLIKDYCADNKVTRQYVHKAKGKFEYFKMSKNKVFVRKKEVA